MQKILILGATSTIAQEVARLLAKDGMDLLLVARSAERLAALKADLLVRGAREVETFAADLDDISRHAEVFAWANGLHSDLDTLFLAYGTLRNQADCVHNANLTIAELHTNFVSAAALLTLFAKHFEEQRSGCLAVITSVAGDRGRRSNYVYGSGKGGLSLFLQGLRSRLHPSGVRVITIKPGPVKTAMTDHMRRTRIFAEVGVVAKGIHRAMKRRSPEVLYTPWHWRYIMAVVRLIPEWIFKRLAV
jgi:decaprenylphospho-beta-D-erythro-pentofuranosid-2-ulose 2-reductase